MKKKIALNKKLIILFFVLIPFIPIRIQYKDVGSVGYKALLYEIIKYPAYMGATEGIQITILGLTVIDTVKPPAGMIFEEE